MEIWKPVPSVVGLEASSYGRIRCHAYVQKMPHGGHRIRSLSATFGCDSYGTKGGEYRRKIFRFRGKTYKAHRCVCEAFNGPSPFDGAVVMHLDEDARNNDPANLRWGTQRENLNASKFRTERNGRIKSLEQAA